MHSPSNFYALHGDVSQYQRKRTLDDFHKGKFIMHVATDVAARGLGISNVDLIIHYELPNGSDAFVHCFGGIGSVGKEGTVVLHSGMAKKG